MLDSFGFLVLGGRGAVCVVLCVRVCAVEDLGFWIGGRGGLNNLGRGRILCMKRWQELFGL